MVAFLGMLLVWHGSGQKSRGLGQFANWHRVPWAVVRVYYPKASASEDVVHRSFQFPVTNSTLEGNFFGLVTHDLFVKVSEHVQNVAVELIFVKHLFVVC